MRKPSTPATNQAVVGRLAESSAACAQIAPTRCADICVSAHAYVIVSRQKRAVNSCSLIGRCVRATRPSANINSAHGENSNRVVPSSAAKRNAAPVVVAAAARHEWARIRFSSRLDVCRRPRRAQFRFEFYSVCKSIYSVSVVFQRRR